MKQIKLDKILKPQIDLEESPSLIIMTCTMCNNEFKDSKLKSDPVDSVKILYKCGSCLGDSLPEYEFIDKFNTLIKRTNKI